MIPDADGRFDNAPIFNFNDGKVKFNANWSTTPTRTMARPRGSSRNLSSQERASTMDALSANLF
jgi:hypothetical protein